MKIEVRHFKDDNSCFLGGPVRLVVRMGKKGFYKGLKYTLRQDKDEWVLQREDVFCRDVFCVGTAAEMDELISRRICRDLVPMISMAWCDFADVLPKSLAASVAAELAP